jgi:hypothetical protein
MRLGGSNPIHANVTTCSNRTRCSTLPSRRWRSSCTARTAARRFAARAINAVPVTGQLSCVFGSASSIGRCRSTSPRSAWPRAFACSSCRPELSGGSVSTKRLKPLDGAADDLKRFVAAARDIPSRPAEAFQQLRKPHLLARKPARQERWHVGLLWKPVRIRLEVSQGENRLLADVEILLVEWLVHRTGSYPSVRTQGDRAKGQPAALPSRLMGWPCVWEPSQQRSIRRCSSAFAS